MVNAFVMNGQDIENESDINLAENVRLYNEKINELTTKAERNGFKIVQEQKIALRNMHEAVIVITLIEGNWYHFCLVGDPSADKIRTSLFLEGVGDIIQDRIKVKREKEFWTEFSFICSRSARYEFTVFQKTALINPLTYLTILKKVRPANEINR